MGHSGTRIFSPLKSAAVWMGLVEMAHFGSWKACLVSSTNPLFSSFFSSSSPICESMKSNRCCWVRKANGMIRIW